MEGPSGLALVVLDTPRCNRQRCELVGATVALYEESIIILLFFTIDLGSLDDREYQSFSFEGIPGEI